MARVKLIVEKGDVAPEHYALFDALAARRGRISGPSTVVFHSPALAGPWNEISEFLHGQSIVEPEHAELAVCVTAREKDCGYVWNAHVPLARKAGVAPATIDAVRDRGPVSGMSDAERAVVLYVRQLLRDNRVDDDVFDHLRKGHDPRWLVELTYWIGRYAALAGVLNAFEVTHPSPIEILPPAPATVPGSTKVRPPHATPRLTYITRRDQVEAAHRSVYDRATEGRHAGVVRGQHGFLLYSPTLAAPHLAVGNHLRFASQVKPDAGELAIIVTAREKDCPYVWAAHAPAARKAGVSEAAISAVRDRGETAGLAASERDIVDYARQILTTNAVAPPVFDRLRDARGVTWLVELTCLIGHYGIVSGILNAFELAPTPDAEALPL